MDCTDIDYSDEVDGTRRVISPEKLELHSAHHNVSGRRNVDSGGFCEVRIYINWAATKFEELFNPILIPLCNLTQYLQFQQVPINKYPFFFKFFNHILLLFPSQLKLFLLSGYILIKSRVFLGDDIRLDHKSWY